MARKRGLKSQYSPDSKFTSNLESQSSVTCTDSARRVLRGVFFAIFQNLSGKLRIHQTRRQPGTPRRPKQTLTTNAHSTRPCFKAYSAADEAACSASSSPSQVKFGPVIPKRRANAAHGAFARHQGNNSGFANATLVVCASAQKRRAVALPAFGETRKRALRSPLAFSNNGASRSIADSID